jgi:hypothetical protein
MSPTEKIRGLDCPKVKRVVEGEREGWAGDDISQQTTKANVNKKRAIPFAFFWNSQ